jgi:hypothetical protein
MQDSECYCLRSACEIRRWCVTTRPASSIVYPNELNSVKGMRKEENKTRNEGNGGEERRREDCNTPSKTSGGPAGV